MGFAVDTGIAASAQASTALALALADLSLFNLRASFAADPLYFDRSKMLKPNETMSDAALTTGRRSAVLVPKSILAGTGRQ